MVRMFGKSTKGACMDSLGAIGAVERPLLVGLVVALPDLQSVTAQALGGSASGMRWGAEKDGAEQKRT